MSATDKQTDMFLRPPHALFRVHSGPDESGSYRFTMEWDQGDRRRGQCFHAALSGYIRQMRDAGYRVEVKDDDNNQLEIAA